MRKASELPEILLLTELYPPAVGGSATLLHQTYRRVHRHPVRVMTEPRPNRDANGSPPIIEEALSTQYWGLARPAALRHHWRVARAVRAHTASSPTVVHCARALPEGVAAWLSHFAGGPRYVCWAHGEDLATARTSRELSWLTSRVFAQAAFALANSQNTSRMLKEIGVASERIRIVYPGVDVTRFSPATERHSIRRRLGVRDQDCLLLSVGRLQRRKGHDLAISAMARLTSTMPSLRYVIVGDGEEKQRLSEMACRHGIGERVTFAGVVPESELPAYYAACDVFLLPNRIDRDDIEGFGIVFIEAAASGRPAIGGNSGGVPEAVENGVTGALVSGTDVTELVSMISRLASDPALRAKWGNAARERVTRLFTWDLAAKSIADLQRELAVHN